MDCFYDARSCTYKAPYGAVSTQETVVFHARPPRHLGVIELELFIAQDENDKQQQCITMQWVGLDGAQDVYHCQWCVPQAGLYWYYFRVKTVSGVYYLSRGYGAKGELGAKLATRFQLTAFAAGSHTPTWFGQDITYQIFPDRFHRSRIPQSDGYRAQRLIHTNWQDTPVYQPDAQGEILNNDFFGGDLRGITEKLDYLASLHVRTLYLNPIFEAYSNHRYDTGDYRTIDPMLGTQEDFIALCAQAKARGIRVILDGVFNHTGYDSRYFNARGSYEEIGAHQSVESRYYDWYDFSKWPDQYASWWGIYTLPQVREESESYQAYIFGEIDSVVRHWLRLGASGWRLDVADELPDWFIQKITQAARAEKEDAIVIGEVWEDASNKIAYDVRRRYFQGDELDSVMNYPLKDALLGFLNGDCAAHFVEHMETLRENYPHAVFYNLMNIVGTHDTPRILTTLGAQESQWKADREHRASFTLTGDALTQAIRRARMAVVIQFTMPGSPCIYYGDEVGMQGFEDPFNRGTYPWDTNDSDMRTFYQALCAVRAQSIALRQGTLRFLVENDGLLVYERVADAQRLVIAINRDDKPCTLQIDCLIAYDMLDANAYYETEDGYSLQLCIQAQQARIFHCAGKGTI